jgi:hypothetical protein
MSAIDRLSKVTTLSDSDLVALFSSAAGSDVAATLSTLVSYLQSELTAGVGLVTQYAAPNASGFSASMYLLLTPVAGYAAGTIVLPSITQDGQEVLVSTTNAITALTISGGTVTGAPTTLAAGGFFRLRYDGFYKTWARVG